MLWRRGFRPRFVMTKRRALFLVFLSIFIPITAVLYQRLRATVPLFQKAAPIVTKMASEKPPVIVVGAGLAGLAASYSALEAGAPAVRLLERGPKAGGNSIKASSGINGAPTKYQNVELYGLDTSFFSDTVVSAGTKLSASVAQPIREHREKLISTLTNRSASAIDFLVELGVDLSVVTMLGGHSIPRTHRGSGKTPPGAAIVTTLLNRLKEKGDRFQLLTESEVTKLLTDPNTGAVTGVEYRALNKVAESETDADATPVPQRVFLHGPVIFTTGGFGGDTHGLLQKYRPDLAGLPSTNDPRPGSHPILSAAGAKLVDMESVQIHPTGFVDPKDPNARLKFLAAEMLRGEGGILLFNGQRFVNELDTREKVSSVIMDLPQSADDEGGLRQWDIQILLDPGACARAENHVAFYMWKGLLQKKKVSELDDVTRQTVKEYAAVVRGEAKDEFGRLNFGHWNLGISGEITGD